MTPTIVFNPSPVIGREVIHSGYNRSSCWVHARCAVDERVPNGERLIVTLQQSLMGRDETVWDVFGPLYMMIKEGGRWSSPVAQTGLAPWEEGERRVVISDFTPQWHRASGTILGLGHTCRYIDNALMGEPRPRETVWSTLAAGGSQWATAQTLELPQGYRFFCSGAGSVQWEEREDGALLVPIYYRASQESASREGTLGKRTEVLVMECRFEDGQLTVRKMGTPLSIANHRGFGEPSLTRGRDRYWLTLRNGGGAYYATSSDGLHFDAPAQWFFDDGEALGSFDTQAHWARLGERLFLIYTRETGQNAHIVRYRAPLLMAEVDQQRGVLLKGSELELIPNRGAQLGNFGVTPLGNDDALICASEWMENAGAWNPEVWNALQTRHPGADLDALAAMPGRCGLCELEGADNSIFLVRIATPG